jgi:hypothetical protein
MTQYSEDCAHCAINAAIDAFKEAHSPVNVDELIDDLTACLCELIAIFPNRDDRRQRMKDVVALIPERVSIFRAEGHYPGGPSQPGGATVH